MEFAHAAIQALSGILAGNLIGWLMPQISLGIAGNTITGLLGGLLLGRMADVLMLGTHDGPLALELPQALDWAAVLADIATGAAFGALLTLAIGLIGRALGE